MDKLFKKYTDPSNPGAFAGLSGFKKNNKYNKVSSKKLLKKVETYTLHKDVKRKGYPKRKTKACGLDHMWQVDLIDLKNIHVQNSHYKFLLTAIDVFGRYAWVVPLKNKSSQENKDAFEKIFSKGRIPKIIYSDMGNEFKGECLKYFNEMGIRHMNSQSIHKASMVERFNRTLKEKIARYLTYSKSKRYIHVLDALVNNYNNSYHRTIKTTPAKVTKDNEKQIYTLLYGDEDEEQIVDFKFVIGDYVREIVDKKTFEKGYTPRWSKEIFIVRSLIPSNPPTYQLKGIDGHVYVWKYYKEELQKVDKNEFPYDTFEIVEETEDQYKVKQINSQVQKEKWIEK